MVAEQSNVLAVLATAGPEVADKVPGGARVGMHFAADILKHSFGVSARQAPLAAEVLLGVLIAAARSWAFGDARRPAVQRLVVATVTALIDSAKENP